MTVSFSPTAACYILAFPRSSAATVSVGALGEVDWPAGWTYYVGRAAGGWTSRLKRFANPEGWKNFWHVDYLVDHAPASVEALIPVDWDGDRECELSSLLSVHPALEPLAPGFGASDCSASCSAHAWCGRIAPPTLYSYLANKKVALTAIVNFSETYCSWERPL